MMKITSFNLCGRTIKSFNSRVEINRNDYASIYTQDQQEGPKGFFISQKGILSTMFSWTCYSVVASQIAAKTNPDANIWLVSIHLSCIAFLLSCNSSHSAFLMSILIGRKIQ